MKYIKQYFPILLILLAFFSGRWTKDDNSKELEEKYEQERKVDRDSIRELQRRAALKVVEFDHFKKQMKSDSAFYAGKLEANQRAYNSLKRKYNEINLNRATSAQLDSIVSVLFPD